jgi:hypothetical protein
MKFLSLGVVTIFTLTILGCSNMKAKKYPEEAGWINMLSSLDDWHTYNNPGKIGTAWILKDGVLQLDATNKKDWQVNNGGDIVYKTEFENFDLRLEWKISKGGNSGIMFNVHESKDYKYPWQTGPEMQVLDNDGHADAKINKHRAGDLYDLIASSSEPVKPAGEWNLVEIVSNKGKLDFFLNGENIISTTQWDESWYKMIAGSKFKDMPGFGKYKSGKIALQDHGDNVWFRNVMIRKL